VGISRQRTVFNDVISLCAVEHFHQNDNCEVKFGELTRTVATKNVTVSALVALFNIHNAQTFWLRGLSGTYVFADENGLFPQLESFGVATARVNSPNSTLQLSFWWK